MENGKGIQNLLCRTLFNSPIFKLQESLPIFFYQIYPFFMDLLICKHVCPELAAEYSRLCRIGGMLQSFTMKVYLVSYICQCCTDGGTLSTILVYVWLITKVT